MARKLSLGCIGPAFMLAIVALISLDTLVVGGELDIEPHGVTGAHGGFVPRDSLPPVATQRRNDWEEVFQRDQARGALFRKSILNRAETLAGRDFKSNVISNAVFGGSNYFTIVGVGTPHRYMYLDMDTGSDITWLQCADCTVCFKQTNALYNPANSSTFKYAECESDLCRKLEVSSCLGDEYCLYSIYYGDGSSSSGRFGSENLVMDAATGPGQVVLSNIPVGCGYVNLGNYIGVAGMLGLGKGALSFPSNVGTGSSTRSSLFSYCLPSRNSQQSTANSNLIFGNAAIPPDAADRVIMYTPQIQNWIWPSQYYVQMTGISVRGNLLTNIPASAFLIDVNGGGGTIIDSSTTVSTLQLVAYAALRDAFRANLDTTNLTLVRGPLIFDTCYHDISGHFLPVSVPSVTLHFLGDIDMELPPSNYMVSIDHRTYCFAFAAETDGPSILANTLQQNFRIIYDNDRQRIGFYPTQC